jgi:hypothetical protein
MNAIKTTAGVLPAHHFEQDHYHVNGATKMKLIQEVLSRARLRRPQAVHISSSEAPRPALRIAIEARREAAREQGLPY